VYIDQFSVEVWQTFPHKDLSKKRNFVKPKNIHCRWKRFPNLEEGNHEERRREKKRPRKRPPQNSFSVKLY